LSKHPADKDIINTYISFQQLAKYKAGSILPAKTGKDNNNNMAVITTAHPNKANLCNFIPGVLIFAIVVMKFIAPNKLLTPDRCKANIARSTLGPLWLCNPDKGG
jgi:hypothetical protein